MPIINNDRAMEALNGYRPLLYKIAFQFGLDAGEASKLVKKAYSSSGIYKTKPEGFASFRVLLSKALVRACIFKISVDLCSKTGMAPDPYAVKDRSAWEHDRRLEDMPLSCRAVHILYEAAGFTEKEIAEILNSTPLIVKERLVKARAFISHRRLASC